VPLYTGSIPLLNKTSEEDLPAFVQAMRDVGFRQVNVTELSPHKGLRSVDSRPFYLPISPIEPLEPRSARFLGYDADSNPLLRLAIRQAMEAGGVAASLPTELFQHGRGVLLFKAVYQGRYTPWTSDARRAL
jgi:CHASE1-domain containing sensor protein